MEVERVDTGRNAKGHFLPGHKPTAGGGRPAGARTILDEKFVKAMLKVFNEGGVEALRILQATDPAAFMRCLVAVLPKAQVTTEERDTVPVIHFHFGSNVQPLDPHGVRRERVIEHEQGALTYADQDEIDADGC